MAGVFGCLAMLPSGAAVLYSGMQDLALPDDFAGVYVNLALPAGAPQFAAFSGWDLNFFFGGQGIANSENCQPVRRWSGAAASILALGYGAAVESAAAFASGLGASGAEDDSGHVGPGSAQFGEGKTNFMGFKLLRGSGAPLYGWMQVVLTSTGQGGVIRDWAYESSAGAAIAAGFTGEVGSRAWTVTGETVAVAGGGAPDNVAPASAVGSALVMNPGSTFTFDQLAEGDFSGTITGSGNLAIVGRGGLTLSGNNPFSGTVAVEAASELAVGNNRNLGSAALRLQDAARLVFQAEVANDGERNTFANPITIGASAAALVSNRGGGVVTLEGAVAGPLDGRLTKTGPGKVVLSGVSENTFSGTTVVAEGELELAKSGGATAIGGDLTISGGTLNVAGSNQIADGAAVRLTAGGSFHFTGSGLTETIGTFHNSGGSFSTGANALIGGGNSVTWSGSSLNVVSRGGLVLDGHIAILGGTNRVEGGGVLQLGPGGLGLEMGAGSALALDSDGAMPGTLLLQGNVTALGTARSTIASGLALAHLGSIDLGGGTRVFTVQAAAGEMLVAAAVSHGSLIKRGPGTLLLSADNPYEGSTWVAGGILRVEGAQAGGGAVSVWAEEELTAQLGGSGSLGGPIAVGLHGILAPGSSIATLGAGALAFTAGSTFAYEMNSAAALGAAGDLQLAAGDLTLGGTVTLTLSDLAAVERPFAVGTTLSLINYSGRWNGGLFSYEAAFLPDEALFPAGVNWWRIDYDAPEGGANFRGEYYGGGDSFVNLVAVVPEPGVAALLALALGARGCRRRSAGGRGSGLALADR